MIEETVVDSLYKDFDSIISFLERNGEISFKSVADEHLKKNLTLSASSYFEYVITESLIEYFKTKSIDSIETVEFIQNKAISRQYHTFFDWNSSNANTFFSLFGNAFKVFMNDKISKDENLKNHIKDFIELGRERNRLVHQNFGAYTIEKTSKEIYELYQSAFKFVSEIRTHLEEFNSSQQGIGKSRAEGSQ
ncbi:MAG: HEPN domain-containing protein [Sediminibacterium sp.]|jgi:hypothetical protein|nr:HEPN domain-containing protein [Sediminibacterium sp.]